jgi:AraC family transcriptional regulator
MPLNQTGAPEILPRPYFENGKRMTIAGLREHYTSSSLDDIPALWRRMTALGKIPGRVGSVDHAVIFPSGNGCDYVAGCEVVGFGDLPKELIRVEIPPRRYAVFSHDGHVAKLRYTFDAIRCIWLPKSGLQIAGTADAGAYVLERYGEGFDPRTGYGDIQVWVPVADVWS